MEELKRKVTSELGLIRFRKVEIEDMKLRIEELELGDTLQAVKYNDMPTGSRVGQKNNDQALYLINSLKGKIRKHEISNRRILNALTILDEEEKEVIQYICIDKVSVNKTSIQLGRKRSTINRIKETSLEKLCVFYQ